MVGFETAEERNFRNHLREMKRDQRRGRPAGIAAELPLDISVASPAPKRKPRPVQPRQARPAKKKVARPAAPVQVRHSPYTQAVFTAIVEHKGQHDGNAPALETIGNGLGVQKSTVFYHVKRLAAAGLVECHDGEIWVKGGRWVFDPDLDQVEDDVLRAVIGYKQTHDGNSPSIY